MICDAPARATRALTSHARAVRSPTRDRGLRRDAAHQRGENVLSGCRGWTEQTLCSAQPDLHTSE